MNDIGTHTRSSDMNMKKKIIVSPSVGSGWATASKHGKILAEDEELIKLVESGAHLVPGESFPETCRVTGEPTGNQLTPMLPSDEFMARAREATGSDELYFGGVDEWLAVETVDGPYLIIVERNGQESAYTAADFW